MTARYGVTGYDQATYDDWGAGAGTLAGTATLSGAGIISAVGAGALTGVSRFAGAALLVHIGAMGTGAITVTLADAPLGSLTVSDST